MRCHLLCIADASKILSSDGACPVSDQVISKSHMKPVDVNPNDEWVNMSMAGISPQIWILHFFHFSLRDLSTPNLCYWWFRVKTKPCQMEGQMGTQIDDSP